MSAPLSSVPSANLDVTFQGDVASGVVDSGNPVKVGGQASSALPVAVLTGQRVNAYFDLNGYLHVKSDATQGDVAAGAADGTSNPLKMGGVASVGIPAAVASGQRVNAYYDLNGYQHVIVDGFTSASGGVTVSGNVGSGVADSGNPVKVGGIYNLVQPTFSSGQRGDLQLDSRGNLGIGFGTGATPIQVVGNVANAATDSGNPIKIGGVFNTALPTLTNGQRGDWQMDAKGAGMVTGHVANATTDVGNPVKIGGVFNTALPTLTNGQRGDWEMDSKGAGMVTGHVANGTTDVGNPVKIGGVFNTALPTLTNGQRGDWEMDAKGAGMVTGHVASGTTDVGNPVKVGGVFNSAPIVLTNGQRGDAQLDASGYLKNREQFVAGAEDNTNNVFAVQTLPLAVATYSYTQFQNLGANATLNVKATAGNVYSLYCHNLNASARYIQLHNTATTPSGGATPARTYLVPGSGTIILDAQYFGPGGINFSTGIAFAFSTTETTYTAGAAADQVTEVNFK